MEGQVRGRLATESQESGWEGRRQSDRKRTRRTESSCLRCYLVGWQAKDKGIDFYDLGSVQADSNKFPSNFGPLGNSPEEPNRCFGRRAEAHGRGSRTGAVLCRRWRQNVNILFPLSGCSNFAVSCLYEAERILWLFHLSAPVYFLLAVFKACCVCCSFCNFSYQGWAATVRTGMWWESNKLWAVHEEFSDESVGMMRWSDGASALRWSDGASALPFPLFVWVWILSLLAEGEVYFSRHPSCGCRTVCRTCTGDGCLFLLEPRRLWLWAHEKTCVCWHSQCPLFTSACVCQRAIWRRTVSRKSPSSPGERAVVVIS